MSDTILKPEKTTSPYDTVCQDCLFAIYDGTTQTGCKLGKLDAYHDNGIQILECYNIDQDGQENEFFVLDKYKCWYKRTTNWTKYSEYLSGQVGLAHIEKELEISYQAIIMMKDCLEDVVKTVVSLKNQTIPPKYYSLVQQGNQFNPLELRREVFSRYQLPDGKIHNIIPNHSPKECMDLALKSHHLPYYLVINAGNTIDDTNLFQTINDKILNQNFKFSIIKIQNSSLVCYSIHHVLNGNYLVDLETKVRSKFQDNTGIYDISEL